MEIVASNPEIQKKLKEEAVHAFKVSESNMDLLTNLPYTSMFIDEVIRLYPPVPIFGRTALEDDQWKGYKIPKGMLIITSPYVVHRNPKYWEDPLKFEPERHLKEKMKEMPRFSYFPYGGGPRTCIGMGYAQIQLPLTVAFLVKNFEFNEKIGPDNMELKASITLGTKT